MTEIVLTTLNAKYAHASFGLRYLMANLGPLSGRAAMLEFEINQRPLDIVEAILAQAPRIVGVGVYIWNAEQCLAVVADLRRLSPKTIIVLGGPEVSHETDQQAICELADFVITGEADQAFASLCQTLLDGRLPLMKVIAAALPQFIAADAATSALALPYDLYSDQDIAHRVIYVEASRGCPFRCEFCLSSLDVPVRNVNLKAFLPAMDRLLARGARSFKFVDRTFNLNLNFSRAILDFFLERYTPGLFLHFEMIPDRLPEALREQIRQFPPGALQFEVGVQTFNDEVSARISRRQDNAKLAENLRFLREQTGVHVHADLIVGLPGEGIESFGVGFDRLLALAPQEIQVGILKRLRGTPITRHDDAFAMVYSQRPPYEVLRTADMDFPTLQRMRRFSRYWDLLGNSGNFRLTTPMLWNGGDPTVKAQSTADAQTAPSPFWQFLSFCDWLHDRFGRNHAIALPAMAEALFIYLAEVLRLEAPPVAAALWSDYQRGGRSDRPAFLRQYLPPADRDARRRALQQVALKRQARHLA